MTGTLCGCCGLIIDAARRAVVEPAALRVRESIRRSTLDVCCCTDACEDADHCTIVGDRNL